MAKNWELNKEDGILTRNYKDEVESFPIHLPVLFKDFLEMELVQQNTIINGLKQKLDDCIARSKDCSLTEVEKRTEQARLWKRISLEREWNLAKEGKVRGPSVSLKVLVSPLVKAGLSLEQISEVTEKPVEMIREFLEKE